MTTLTTRLGPVRAHEAEGVLHVRGIRYGAPPTGTRRFAPPEPAGAWDGVHDGTAFPPRAMQAPGPSLLERSTPPGPVSEDCLFLNVCTPAADSGRRPVLVWIHGGGYQTGSANEYDGAVLAGRGDVVVVGVGFRLGIFGWLDLSRLGPSLAGSASNGLRDVIAALGWVRENIADYGGDPDNVTIAGESSGGGMVLGLLAAPSADGLYHRAFAASPGGCVLPPVDATPVLAAALGVDDGALVEHLRSLPAGDLLAVQQQHNPPVAGTIDGTVVTRSAATALRERGASGVPVIAGYTRDEGTFFTAVTNPEPAVATAMSTAMATLLLEGRDPTGYLERLRATYADADERRINELVWTDVYRRASTVAVEAASAAGPGGWHYRFDLPTSVLDGSLGATHACDLPFIFDALGREGSPQQLHDERDPSARALASAWSSTIVAFARTGDPNGAGLPTWPRYAADDRRSLVLGSESRIEADLDGRYRKIWEDT